MKKILLLFLCLYFPLLAFNQTTFKGKKLNYSFTIPSGWHIKDNFYSQETDGKIIDGKGNSFIVTISKTDQANTQTAEKYFGSYTTSELETLLSSEVGKVKIIERKTYIIDSKTYYYIYHLTTASDGFKTYSKMYFYNLKYYCIVLNATCLEKYIYETKTAFAQIIASFKY